MRADWGLISLNVIPACSGAQLLIVTLCDVWCVMATRPWYLPDPADKWRVLTSSLVAASLRLWRSVTVMTAGCSLASPGLDYVTSWAPAHGGDTTWASLRHITARGQRLASWCGPLGVTLTPGPHLGWGLTSDGSGERGEAAVNTPLVTRQWGSQSVTHCPLSSPPTPVPPGPATVCWSQVVTPLLSVIQCDV